MSTHKRRDIFVQGAIDPAFIADSIAKHADKTGIGGHSIFLGQVRADIKDGQQVCAIEYTAYVEMALDRMQEIRDAIFAKYPLTCMHVHHSLGRVEVGQLCLFVFTSAAHRKEAIEACSECVERIKAELPIWGKEWLADEGYQWKKNQ